MTSDRVGDFIIRLKNAGAVGKAEVRMPYSAHIATIAKKLSALHYVGKVSIEDDEKQPAKKWLTIALNYDDRGKHRIHGVARISKPGRRLYAGAREAHGIKSGMGARIYTTPAGIVSDREARKAKVGGEILFDIW